MKHLPRALNRFGLFVIGLITAALGVGLVLVGVWDKAAQWWQTHSDNALQAYSHATEQTRIIFYPSVSWLTVLWAVLGVVILVLMLVWIFRQGGGSTRQIDTQDSGLNDGDTVASLAFAQQLIHEALNDDRWIVDVKVSGWDVKGDGGLNLKVTTEKGADPLHVKTIMDSAINRLDDALGETIPICVHVTSGWQQSFTSASRVDS